MKTIQDTFLSVQSTSTNEQAENFSSENDFKRKLPDINSHYYKEHLSYPCSSLLINLLE